MRRGAFIGGLGSALIPSLADAGAPACIVAARCNLEEYDEQAEDILAEELLSRHVDAVDPSAIDVTYHRRMRLEMTRMLGAASIDYSDLAWTTVRYHARRLLVADVVLRSSSLPYGDFIVHEVRARCSFRAFDTAGKQLVAAGSTAGSSRGEDEGTAQEDALRAALRAAAARATPRLRS